MQALGLFFRLWLWFSYRHLRANRWRAMAVLLGIALGAAVFTSVRLAIDASMTSFSQTMDVIAGKADRVVVGTGGRVPEGLVAQLIKHSAVETASPILTTYVLPEVEGAEPLLLIGLDPILDRPLRAWQARKGASGPSAPWLDLMSEPGTLFVSRKISEKYHLSPGDRVTLDHVQRKQEFRIAGLLDPQGLALADGGQIAIADISSFQEFTGLNGYVDRIDLLLKTGASERDLTNIRAMLPDSVTVEMPAESKESGRLMIRSYELNLSVLSFVSLFVGMFLVYSLVALHASSRRHELAILRSIGASPRMIFLLFLAEGAFLGLAGWLAAIPLGSVIVRHLLGLVSSTITHLFVRVQASHLVLAPAEILASFLITLAVSVLAVLQPAREAMKVPPREAMLMLKTSQGPGKSTRKLAALGLLLILAVWPLSKLPSLFGMPLPGYVATFFLFSGFSLLSPWVLQLMGTHLPPFLRRIGGETAYLAGRYIRDSGTRIAISVGALITAVALFVALVVMVYSFRSTVELWVNQSISGDLFITSKLAALNHYRDPLPREVVSMLEALQPPAQVLPYRRIYMHQGRAQYLFEPIDLDAFLKHGRFLFMEGDPEEILPDLVGGRGVVVSEVFANQTGLSVGKIFHARIGGSEWNLPVLGIFRDYRTQGGVVNYSLRAYQERTGDFSWSGARIHLSGSALDTEAASAFIRNEVLRCCLREGHAVEVTAGGDLRGGIMKIFDETFAITTVLLLIALVVAALGITTTLTVLVTERARQLHTLLAGGASRGQIRSMIFWEAVLMVLAGEAMGMACGFSLSYLLIYVINRQSFGWTFIYGADWPYLLASCPLILASALLAALPASQMVFRQSSALVMRER